MTTKGPEKCMVKSQMTAVLIRKFKAYIILWILQWHFYCSKHTSSPFYFVIGIYFLSLSRLLVLLSFAVSPLTHSPIAFSAFQASFIYTERMSAFFMSLFVPHTLCCSLILHLPCPCRGRKDEAANSKHRISFSLSHSLPALEYQKLNFQSVFRVAFWRIFANSYAEHFCISFFHSHTVFGMQYRLVFLIFSKTGGRVSLGGQEVHSSLWPVWWDRVTRLPH